MCRSSIFTAVKDDDIHDGKHFLREKKIMKQGGEVGIDIYWVLTIFEPTQK